LTALCREPPWPALGKGFFFKKLFAERLPSWLSQKIIYLFFLKKFFGERLSGWRSAKNIPFFKILCRVPGGWHSAKLRCAQLCREPTLGKAEIFAVF